MSRWRRLWAFLTGRYHGDTPAERFPQMCWPNPEECKHLTHPANKP